MADMHNMLAHIGTAGHASLRCAARERPRRRERAPTTSRTSRRGSACYLAVSNSVASSGPLKTRANAASAGHVTHLPD
jgi:hypothetical protein